MFGEAHAHVFMNGTDYQAARRMYETGIREEDIRNKLLCYQKAKIAYVRDGGDPYGACVLARHLAGEYGIEYRIPVFAIYQKGHYGGIVGRGFETMREYRQLVREVDRQGGDFIKVMFSGILDFRRDGAVTGTPLGREQIREMIHIAHEEGFAVMAHVNTSRAVLDAIEGGVDSVEHGNFMDEETIEALACSRAVWVPTNVTIHNLLGKGRYDDGLIARLDEQQAESIRRAWAKGASIAPGSDAGAYGVLHGRGLLDEVNRLRQILSGFSGVEEGLRAADRRIRKTFRRG